jgi:hypothetical protein
MGNPTWTTEQFKEHIGPLPFIAMGVIFCVSLFGMFPACQLLSL